MSGEIARAKAESLDENLIQLYLDLYDRYLERFEGCKHDWNGDSEKVRYVRDLSGRVKFVETLIDVCALDLLKRRYPFAEDEVGMHEVRINVGPHRLYYTMLARRGEGGDPVGWRIYRDAWDFLGGTREQVEPIGPRPRLVRSAFDRPPYSGFPAEEGSG